MEKPPAGLSPSLQTWSDPYAMLEALDAPTPNTTPEIRLDCKMMDITTLAWARWLSQKCGVSVVVGQELTDKQLSFDAVNETVPSLVQLAARQLGVGVASFGGNYYIGQVRPEDVSVLVRKSGRFDRKEIEELVRVCSGSMGKVRAFDDGLFVVSDTLGGIKRIVEAMDLIDAHSGRLWLVQLYLVRVSDESDRETSIGADLDVSWRFAQRSAGGAAGSLLDATFDSFLRARSERSAAVIEQSPLLIVEEGSTGKIHSGRTVPVPQRAVSDQGTITVTGYEKIKDGLELSVTIRDGQRRGEGVLDLSISQSQISGYVAEAPILSEERIETRATVQSGGVYLLAKIAQAATTHSRKGFLALGKTEKSSKAVIEVWGKMFAVRAFNVSPGYESRGKKSRP